MRKLLLFDIDGTLLWGGPAKDAFQQALVETYGTAGDIEVHSFAGKTDPQIARELLRGAGLSDGEIDEGLPELWRRYLEGLEDGLTTRPMTVLPGVVALLDALSEHPDVALGLLTGNIRDGARLKLGSAGLFDRFGVGSFGSDAEDRDQLPPLAIRRASETWGAEFGGDAVVVVGDTPRDVQCGLSHGTRTLGVATGHFEVGELHDAGAHSVVDDFSDTAAVLDLLTA